MPEPKQRGLFEHAPTSARQRLGIPQCAGPLVVSWGAGVDSTAMLVALKREGIVPDAILFSDTGGEKPETYAYIDYIATWLARWGAPPVTRLARKPSKRVAYRTLEENCLANETLPSLAYGRHGCSLKWKGTVLDQHLAGVARGPNARPAWPPAQRAWRAGRKVVKLIGYDASGPDQRRRRRIARESARYHHVFPLQHLEWTRTECVRAIVEEGLRVPIKSACFFCPASKPWELWWLAGEHPDLFLRALALERTALEGRHSRWNAAALGGTWRAYVEADRAIPRDIHAGLGRRFSWNQFARTHRLVDETGRFTGERERCLERAAALRGRDNALDARAR